MNSTWFVWFCSIFRSPSRNNDDNLSLYYPRFASSSDTLTNILELYTVDWWCCRARPGWYRSLFPYLLIIGVFLVVH